MKNALAMLKHSRKTKFRMRPLTTKRRRPKTKKKKMSRAR